MRAISFRFVVSLVVVPLGLGLGMVLSGPGPALGQVNLNLDALNAPAGGQTPQANRPARPAARPGQTTRTTRPRAGTQPGKPASTSQATRTPAAAAPATATPAATTPATTTPATTASAPAAPAGATPAPANSAPTISAPTNNTPARATTPAASPAGTASGVAGGAALGAAAAMGAAGTAALILPERAPEAPVLAEPSPVASTPQPAPPPRPVTTADAGSSTARLADGLRVIFAAGKSDLTPASAAILTEFAKAAPRGETVSFNVQAYAAGPVEDPSAARRLSLARALAIRAALMADGIASTRIYVRAMGTPASTDTEAVDRVDIAILGATTRTQLGAPAPVRP